ncbi:thiamine-triphosphatase isoform X2 [Megalops cyprinoides]|uniref:thiamine-triphosphatase isoform X2 n=1 Tax=Megalops cyprinoides TaxID=118141 RepID=UPI001864A48B|nr:thiamine-triphosphatase isoform X2 [Megalops cyprinoides]
MNVEVERKFVCDPDIQNKLRDIGAVCVGQSKFHDQYFDSPDFCLTLRDVWLRRRQGCWELKCPSSKSTPGMEEEERLCSRYREITSLPQIIAKVRDVMKHGCEEQGGQRVSEVEEEGKEGDRQGHKGATGETKTGSHIDQKDPMINHSDKPNTKRSDTVNKDVTGFEDANQCSLEKDSDLSWLRELNLVPFAEFTTERCSFSLSEEGEEGVIHVDLDKADFGFCVGEIEVLVPDGKEVQSALKKIQRTAERLGLSGDQRIQGKMDVYLQRYCPEHYRKLLNAHVL